MRRKWSSRKWWMGLWGVLAPVLFQALTSGLGWRDAIGLSTIAAVCYLAAEGYVDGQGARRVAEGPPQ